MNTTQEALLNLQALNQQQAQAFQPFNNYAGTNLQYGLMMAKAKQEQTAALQKLQFDNQLAMQKQQAMIDAQRGMAREAQSGEYARAQLMEHGAQDRGLSLERMRVEHEDNVRIKDQADKIRANPDARELIGSDISNFDDSPDGNRKLIASYNKVLGDPNLLENVHTNQAVALTKQIKNAVSRLSSTVSGSAESRTAMQRFFADPAVAALLAKKGKMTAGEVQKIATSGDPGQISKLIDQVANEAILPGTSRDITAQLLTAWNTAQIETKQNPTPDSLVNVDYLKSLMQRRDGLLNQGTIRSEGAWNKIAEAQGFGAPPVAKLPPPAKPVGLASPQIQQPNTNPFGTPYAPIPGEQKMGLASLVQPSGGLTGNFTDIDGSGVGPTHMRLSPGSDTERDRDKAFAPVRLASDPASEYAVRQDLLNSARTREATRQGLSQAIPFVPNYTPQYNAFDQTQDEAKLTDLVRGLYSPSK